ncbi:hypothetical protein B0H19DRAFT_1157291 [Mycena capillaripes]|nr:hypothetical protein B0H19DRAFT_1157291 [Mycena capillaripes]
MQQIPRPPVSSRRLMLPTSYSESPGLGRPKQKAAELQIDAQAVYAYVLARLRGEYVFAAIDADDWEKVTKKILHNPLLPPPSYKSRPFADAHPFYEDLFQDPVRYISLCEYQTTPPSENKDSTAPEEKDAYQEASVALQQNPLWKGVQHHVIMDNETSCRTAIDLMMLTAIELAQKQIAEKPDIDEALRIRHSLTGPKARVSDGHEVGSWIVLHHEVEIPDQYLLPELAMHGVLDFVVAVVSARKAMDAMNSGSPFLPKASLYAPRTFIQYIETALATLLEAKTQHTLETPKIWAQVTAQGAAICVSTNRPSVINILTDGLQWQFVRVDETPDTASAPEPRRRRSTDRPTEPPSSSAPTSSAPPAAPPTNSRTTSQRIASKQTAPTTPKKPAPFKAARTRLLSIFNKQDLPMVLRLLTLAITSSPDEFEELAAETA